MFGNIDFTLFGVSWILVGSMLVALVRRYVSVPEEAVKLSAALWMALGMFIDKAWVDQQWMFPSDPMGWVALGLQIFIFFGSILGLAPGETARKAVRKVKSLVIG